MNKVHFLSNSCEWETPLNFFQKYNEIYNFTLDTCASNNNAKCSKYFTKETNGLLQDWSKDICWMNPPYGREIKNWVKKAYESNSTVVCLLPARTDTKWFHEYCLKGKIEFIKGRLKFNNNKNSAPFPSMIVIFEPKSIK